MSLSKAMYLTTPAAAVWLRQLAAVRSTLTDTHDWGQHFLTGCVNLAFAHPRGVPCSSALSGTRLDMPYVYAPRTRCGARIQTAMDGWSIRHVGSCFRSITVFFGVFARSVGHSRVVTFSIVDCELSLGIRHRLVS